MKPNCEYCGAVIRKREALKHACKMAKERDEGRVAADRLTAELDKCAAVLPGAYYMDPPDGGDVSVSEQLRRMAKDAERYRYLRRKVAIVGAQFLVMNMPSPVYVAPDAAAEFDSALDAERSARAGARPPTPVGWSDTDWIRHLQEQGGPHPLAGQHINQGSMDAEAEVERLVDEFVHQVENDDDLYERLAARAALRDYVRGILAERDALITDNERLMQIAAQESDVGARVLREVFALCEDTQDKCSEDANDFTRGRRFEAKGIARAIGTWYQDEFCGRTHMGEPDLTADQFRDAAEMVPAAWQVWCGLGKMQPYWPVFRTKEEAEECAKTIKTYTEVRPLWSHASAAPQPVGAAEVQFPMSDKTLYGSDRTVSGHFYTAAQVRTYGDAREAAGYARRIAALDALLAQIDVCRRDGFIDTPGNTAAFCISEGAWIELVSCADEVALRGEVK